MCADISLVFLDSSSSSFYYQGAFYILVNISSTGMESMDFAKYLLKNYGVAVAPGECFGTVTANYVRVSVLLAVNQKE